MLQDICMIGYISSHDYFTEYLLNSTKDLIRPTDIYIKDDSIIAKLFTNKSNRCSIDSCKKRKLNYYKTKLTLLKNKYKLFMITESDCHFFHNMEGWNELFRYIQNSPKQTFFMKDDISNNIHTSFFIIKDTFVDVFVNYIKKDLLNDSNELMSENLIMNKAKTDFNYDFIPSKFIIWGNKCTVLCRNSYIIHHIVIANTNLENHKKQINGIERFMKN